MIVEGYIEFVEDKEFFTPKIRGVVTASSYPNTTTGTIYCSGIIPGNDDIYYTFILFYKSPNQNWAINEQIFEMPGYQRFLWLTEYDFSTAPKLTAEQLDAVALERYSAVPLDLNTQYYWSLYNPAQPLSTPTGLYADNITSDSATTHWTGDANASNYKVQYKAAGDTVWTETFTD